MVGKLVSVPPSQRSVTYWHDGRLRVALHQRLELLLGADEEDVVALEHHIAQQLLRLVDLPSVFWRSMM
jgi:hypothetical protein